MHRSIARNLVAALAVACSTVIAAWPALGQALPRLDALQVDDLRQCPALAPVLEGRGSGGQWLVGDGIVLTGEVAGGPVEKLDGAFEKVVCYNRVDVAGRERVFVAKPDLSLCGWTDRANLLPEHPLSTALGQSSSRAEAVCETPRAMPFSVYCAVWGEIAGQDTATEECEGLPPLLRTKGVLVGNTIEDGETPRFPFMTAPSSGEARGSKTFFSVLDVHDVRPGADGSIMMLVGDGAGDLFGWVDRRALRLWPTRLGLYYDETGSGGLFLRESEMKQNAARGEPAPQLSFNGTAEELRDFLHGKLPLLSYPIVRTVDPSTDPLQPLGAPAWHEVIYIGATGDGVINQARIGETVQNLRQVNVIFAVDTTESMTNYLPFIRDGIAEFVRRYNRDALDEAGRLPDMRLSVVAYSDFTNADRMGPGDNIRTEVLMPPRRLGPNFDNRLAIDRIAAHGGLKDEVGEFDEAAFEAVMQLSAAFDGEGWFLDGPRVIVHIGDHGSRDSLDLSVVEERLAAQNVYYIPVVVVTEDHGNVRRKQSRARFERQALRLLAPLIEVDRSAKAGLDDLSRVDLADPGATSGAVREALDLVVRAVTVAIERQRAQVTGIASPAARNPVAAAASSEALNRAASRIRLDAALERQYGLGSAALRGLVQVDTAFAPFSLVSDGLKRPIDWAYTIALEPAQVEFLQQNFNDLCSLVGRDEHRARFRALVIRLAEVFSGDVIRTDEVQAVLSDLQQLPATRGSFLAIPSQQLLERIDSTDPEMQAQLQKDVCWISYHLNNVVANAYVKPMELHWNFQTRRFQLKSGVSAQYRSYLYTPLVGTEVVYLPSWMFVLPSSGLTEVVSDGGSCIGWTCD